MTINNSSWNSSYTHSQSPEYPPAQIWQGTVFKRWAEFCSRTWNAQHTLVRQVEVSKVIYCKHEKKALGWRGECWDVQAEWQPGNGFDEAERASLEDWQSWTGNGRCGWAGRSGLELNPNRLETRTETDAARRQVQQLPISEARGGGGGAWAQSRREETTGSKNSQEEIDCGRLDLLYCYTEQSGKGWGGLGL